MFRSTALSSLRTLVLLRLKSRMSPLPFPDQRTSGRESFGQVDKSTEARENSTGKRGFRNLNTLIGIFMFQRHKRRTEPTIDHQLGCYSFAGDGKNLKYGFFRVQCERLFTTKDTQSTKFEILIIQTLRVLRELRGERNQGDSARLLTQKPEEPKYQRATLCPLSREGMLEVRR